MGDDGPWGDGALRVEYPGAVYHAMSRGDRREPISRDDEDRQKFVSTNYAGDYYSHSTNRFVYDGWNVIAELNRTNGVVQSFLWGLDLSGSTQGAGGLVTIS